MEENREFDVKIEDENTARDAEPEEAKVKEAEEMSEAADAPEPEEAKADSEEKESDTGKKRSGRKKKRSADALELLLKKKEEEAEDYKDRFQRLMAEFENARKRTAREQSRMYDVGAKDVLEKLLPVVDNFERGIDVLSDEEKEDAFAQGVIRIYQQLMDVLADIGVTPMNAKGKEFNPEFHNAVMHEEDEEMGDNIVSEEFQKGYMYKDQVLRHSMVKVVN